MEVNDKSNSEYWQDLCYDKKLEKLLKDGYLADCKFVVGPNKDETEIIHGHKLMLALESPVFEKLFEGNFSEGKNLPEVHIEDFHPKDFKNFIFLIYYHNAQPNTEQLFSKYCMEEIVEIYCLCHKYMVTSILEKFEQFFQLKSFNSSLITKEMILLFELAHKLNDDVLITLIKKYIPTRSHFFDPILNQLPLGIFYKYIAFLNMLPNRPPATQVFNCIEDYFLRNNLITKEEKTLTEDKDEINCYSLNNFLKFVNFKTMTAEQFKTGPGKSHLLDWQFKYESLSQLIPMNSAVHSILICEYCGRQPSKMALLLQLISSQKKNSIR